MTQHIILKKGHLPFIILLCIGLTTNSLPGQTTEKSSIPQSRGHWLYVGGSGPENYTRIQDAIDHTMDGDTVFVYDDASPYIENLKVYHKIKIYGENKNSTEIKGFNPNDEIIEITTADFVTISGFTITSDNETFVPAIRVYSCCNTIAGNIFKDDNITFETAEVGIALTSTSLFCTIHDNVFQNTSKGIDLEDSSYNDINNNSFRSNSFGIIIFYGEENAIANNTFLNGSCGMLLSRSNASHIVDNVFISSRNEAIEIGGRCSDNQILRNTIRLCGEGIDLSLLSDNNKIQGNSLQQNSQGITILSSCDFNVIEQNAIMENQEYGIWIQGSDNEVHLNVIKDNEEAGIHLSGQSNTISHNLIENNSKGIYLHDSNHNTISCNNFISNEGFFMYYFLTHWVIKNVWDNNYWDTVNGNVKIIWGRLKIVLFTWSDWFSKQTYELAVYPRRCNVDWHPAKEPFDIPNLI